MTLVLFMWNDIVPSDIYVGQWVVHMIVCTYSSPVWTLVKGMLSGPNLLHNMENGS